MALTTAVGGVVATRVVGSAVEACVGDLLLNANAPKPTPRNTTAMAAPPMMTPMLLLLGAVSARVRAIGAAGLGVENCPPVGNGVPPIGSVPPDCLWA